MRCDTSVGKARRGSVLVAIVLLGRRRGPGARRLFAPERVGEDVLDVVREAPRDRVGVPGVVVCPIEIH